MAEFEDMHPGLGFDGFWIGVHHFSLVKSFKTYPRGPPTSNNWYQSHTSSLIMLETQACSVLCMRCEEDRARAVFGSIFDEFAWLLVDSCLDSHKRV